MTRRPQTCQGWHPASAGTVMMRRRGPGTRDSLLSLAPGAAGDQFLMQKLELNLRLQVSYHKESGNVQQNMYRSTPGVSRMQCGAAS
eukprot:70461-Hanusia_phi.AAC.1